MPLALCLRDFRVAVLVRGVNKLFHELFRIAIETFYFSLRHNLNAKINQSTMMESFFCLS